MFSLRIGRPGRGRTTTKLHAILGGSSAPVVILFDPKGEIGVWS